VLRSVANIKGCTLLYLADLYRGVIKKQKANMVGDPSWSIGSSLLVAVSGREECASAHGDVRKGKGSLGPGLSTIHAEAGNRRMTNEHGTHAVTTAGIQGYLSEMMKQTPHNTLYAHIELGQRGRQFLDAFPNSREKVLRMDSCRWIGQRPSSTGT